MLSPRKPDFVRGVVDGSVQFGGIRKPHPHHYYTEQWRYLRKLPTLKPLKSVAYGSDSAH
jgi:hypothetical protein